MVYRTFQKLSTPEVLQHMAAFYSIYSILRKAAVSTFELNLTSGPSRPPELRMTSPSLLYKADLMATHSWT